MLMPVRSGLFKSINRAFPYLGRGCIVFLAALCFVTTEAWVLANWSAASYVVAPAEPINRASKGDRLPLPRIGRADHELPVGCESVISAVVRSPLSHVARDCLS